MQVLKEASQIEEKLVVDLAYDVQKKAQFQANPKNFLKTHYGIDIPKELEVHVHVNDENNIHFVVPTNPEVLMY